MSTRFISCCVLAAAGLFCASVVPASTKAQGFTLDEGRDALNNARELLGRGFASASQRYLAWVDKGELFIASEPEFVPRTLVARTADSVVASAFPSSDGRSLLYISERAKPSPSRELLALDLETGKSTVVASGNDVPSDFVFAPNGNAIAYAEGREILEYRRVDAGRWERRSLLKSDDPRHLAAVELGGLAYSPDATKIAFVSVRKAKQQYIAIHDIERTETRYIEPGIFRDAVPVWSPDGTELAFVRLPGNWTKQYRFTPQREGAPWSILVANAKSGAVRTVWKADAGLGSIAYGSRLTWAKTGDLLFRWEKTGWSLLYAVAASGGRPRLLTPGEAEIENFVLSADQRTVIYQSNQGDLGRAHVWSVSLDTGKPVQLTSGTGVERNPKISAGGYVSYLADNHGNLPPQLMLRGPDGKQRALTVLSKAAETSVTSVWRSFLPTEVIRVTADDGVVSHHVLIKPSTPPPASGYPVIVAAKGGPMSRVLPGIGNYTTFGQYAASRGYLFVDINYRGSTGFGRDYREPRQGGAAGASEVHDLAGLAKYLQGRKDVNPKRIGIMGLSYGGHMVGVAMSRLPDQFAAGVSLYGVADWVVEMKKDQQDEGGMSAPPEFIRLSERVRIEDLAYESSPPAHLANWRGPTLFTMGDLDSKGHMESLIDLGNQLMERGVPVEFYVDPAGGHNVFPQQRVFEFFERNLQ
ncbi:prolyl oligopeptidase family serine peptidase [Steroidobacter sp.]|uniref:S9 family peptidase n=1 Tax=Steroidobacter sp. TaxID=1978227 RepID=UPI001A5B6AA0|nr:prolyl oligopeptidase family serine peptidase [Steroidobacter sp.]MBL8265104.1 S9 family peptidase [Steroidobacter sp.]